MKRYGRTIRIIALVVVHSFVVEQLAFAAPAVNLSKLDLFAKPKVDLGIPASIATIEEAYVASSGTKTLYLIQDAHTNFSGQLNVARTLDHLVKEKTKYVFLEAGSGDESLSFLRKYADLKDRQRLSESFLRQAKLQGSEYFDLTSDREFVLWGVEDLPLYVKSVEAYKQVVKDREKFQTYLKKVEATVEALKPRIYGPALLSFDGEYRKFKKEDLSLTDYFEVLTTQAQIYEISLKNYPHLAKLKALKDKETKIDFKKASEEQSQAIQALSEADQKELLDLAENQKKPFKLSGSDHKEDKAFYTLLEEKLEGQKFSELSKYFAYLKEAKALNPAALLEEQKKLEIEIFEALAVRPDELSLVWSSKRLEILKKLLSLTLTPDDWQTYEKDRKAFDIKTMTGFLNKKIMDLHSYYDRAVFLEEGYETIIEKAGEFYGLTYDRDQKFAENSLQKMDKENQTHAVLITGGFHSPNLKYLLKQKNVSFVNITPQVFHETDLARYEQILLGQVTKLQKMAQTPTLKSAGIISATGMDTRTGHGVEFAMKIKAPQPAIDALRQRDLAAARLGITSSLIDDFGPLNDLALRLEKVNDLWEDGFKNLNIPALLRDQIGQPLSGLTQHQKAVVLGAILTMYRAEIGPQKTSDQSATDSAALERVTAHFRIYRQDIDSAISRLSATANTTKEVILVRDLLTLSLELMALKRLGIAEARQMGQTTYDIAAAAALQTRDRAIQEEVRAALDVTAARLPERKKSVSKKNQRSAPKAGPIGPNAQGTLDRIRYNEALNSLAKTGELTPELYVAQYEGRLGNVYKTLGYFYELRQAGLLGKTDEGNWQYTKLFYSLAAARMAAAESTVENDPFVRHGFTLPEGQPGNFFTNTYVSYDLGRILNKPIISKGLLYNILAKLPFFNRFADLFAKPGWQMPDEVVNAVRQRLQADVSEGLIKGFIVRDFGGRDLDIHVTHSWGENNVDVHRLIFVALQAGLQKAVSLGLIREEFKSLKTDLLLNNLAIRPGEHSVSERDAESVVIAKGVNVSIGAVNIKLFHEFAVLGSTPLQKLGLGKAPGFRFVVRRMKDILDGKSGDENTFEFEISVDRKIKKEDEEIFYHSVNEGPQLLGLVGQSNDYAITAVYPVEGGGLNPNEPVATVIYQQVNGNGGNPILNPTIIYRSQSGADAVGGIGSIVEFVNFVPGGPTGENFVATMPVSLEEARRAPQDDSGVGYFTVYGYQSRKAGQIPAEAASHLDHIGVNPFALYWERFLAWALSRVMRDHDNDQPYLAPWAAEKRVEHTRAIQNSVFVHAPKDSEEDPFTTEIEDKVAKGELVSVTDDKADMGGVLGHTQVPLFMTAVYKASLLRAKESGIISDGNTFGDLHYDRMKDDVNIGVGDDGHLLMLGDKSPLASAAHQLSFLGFTRAYLFSSANRIQPYGEGQDYQGREAQAAKANPYFYSQFDQRFFDILREIMPMSFMDPMTYVQITDEDLPLLHQMLSEDDYQAVVKSLVEIKGPEQFSILQQVLSKKDAEKAAKDLTPHLGKKFIKLNMIQTVEFGWHLWDKKGQSAQQLNEPFSGNVSQQGIGSARYFLDLAWKKLRVADLATAPIKRGLFWGALIGGAIGAAVFGTAAIVGSLGIGAAVGAAYGVFQIIAPERTFDVIAGDKMGPAALNRLIKRMVYAALKANEFAFGLVFEIWDAKAFDKDGNIALEDLPALLKDVKGQFQIDEKKLTSLKTEDRAAYEEAKKFVLEVAYADGEKMSSLTVQQRSQLAEVLKKYGYVPTKRIFLDAEKDKDAIIRYLADSDRFNIKNVWAKKKAGWDIFDPKAYLNRPLLGSSITRLGILTGGEYVGKDDPVMLGHTRLLRYGHSFMGKFLLIIQGDMNGSHWLAAIPTALKYAVATVVSHPIMVGLRYRVSKDGQTLESVRDIYGGWTFAFNRMKAFAFNWFFRVAQLGGQHEPYGTNVKTVEGSYDLAKLLNELNRPDSPFLLKNIKAKNVIRAAWPSQTVNHIDKVYEQVFAQAAARLTNAVLLLPNETVRTSQLPEGVGLNVLAMGNNDVYVSFRRFGGGRANLVQVDFTFLATSHSHGVVLGPDESLTIDRKGLIVNGSDQKLNPIDLESLSSSPLEIKFNRGGRVQITNHKDDDNPTLVDGSLVSAARLTAVAKNMHTAFARPEKQAKNYFTNVYSQFSLAALLKKKTDIIPDQVLDAIRNYLTEEVEQKHIKSFTVYNWGGTDIDIHVTHNYGKYNASVHDVIFKALRAGLLVANESGLLKKNPTLLSPVELAKVTDMRSTDEHSISERGSESVGIVKILGGLGAVNIKLLHEFGILGSTPLQKLGSSKAPGFVFVVRRMSDIEKGDTAGKEWRFEISAEREIKDKQGKLIKKLPSVNESVKLLQLASQPNDYVITSVYPVEGGSLPASEPIATVPLPVFDFKTNGRRIINPTILLRLQSGADAVGGAGSIMEAVNFVPGGPDAGYFVATQPVAIEEGRRVSPKGKASTIYYGYQSHISGRIPIEQIVDHVGVNPPGVGPERNLADRLGKIFSSLKDHLPFKSPQTVIDEVEPVRSEQDDFFSHAPKESETDSIMTGVEDRVQSGDLIRFMEDKADMGGTWGHTQVPTWMTAIYKASMLEAAEKGEITQGNTFGSLDYERIGDDENWGIGDDGHMWMWGDKSPNGLASHKLSFKAFTRAYLFSSANKLPLYGEAQDFLGAEAKRAKTNPYKYAELTPRFLELLKQVMPPKYLNLVLDIEDGLGPKNIITRVEEGLAEFDRTGTSVHTLQDTFSGNVSQQGIGSAGYDVDVKTERTFDVLAGDKMGPAALNPIIHHAMFNAVDDKDTKFANGLVVEIWDAKAFDPEGNISLKDIPQSFHDVETLSYKKDDEAKFVEESYESDQLKSLDANHLEKLAEVLKRNGYVPAKRIFLDAKADRKAIVKYLADSDRFNVKRVWSKKQAGWDKRTPQRYLDRPVLGSSVTRLGILTGGEYVGKDDPVMVGHTDFMRYVQEFIRTTPVIIQGDMNGSHWLWAIPTALKHSVATKDSHPIFTMLRYHVTPDGKFEKVEDLTGEPSFDKIRAKALQFNHDFKIAQLGGQFQPLGTHVSTVEGSYDLAKELKALNREDNPQLTVNRKESGKMVGPEFPVGIGQEAAKASGLRENARVLYVKIAGLSPTTRTVYDNVLANPALLERARQQNLSQADYMAAASHGSTFTWLNHDVSLATALDELKDLLDPSNLEQADLDSLSPALAAARLAVQKTSEPVLVSDLRAVGQVAPDRVVRVASLRDLGQPNLSPRAVTLAKQFAVESLTMRTDVPATPAPGPSGSGRAGLAAARMSQATENILPAATTKRLSQQDAIESLITQLQALTRTPNVMWTIQVQFGDAAANGYSYFSGSVNSERTLRGSLANQLAPRTGIFTEPTVSIADSSSHRLTAGVSLISPARLATARASDAQLAVIVTGQSSDGVVSVRVQRAPDARTPANTFVVLDVKQNFNGNLNQDELTAFARKIADALDRQITRTSSPGDVARTVNQVAGRVNLTQAAARLPAGKAGIANPSTEAASNLTRLDRPSSSQVLSAARSEVERALNAPSVTVRNSSATTLASSIAAARLSDLKPGSIVADRKGVVYVVKSAPSIRPSDGSVTFYGNYTLIPIPSQFDISKLRNGADSASPITLTPTEAVGSIIEHDLTDAYLRLSPVFFDKLGFRPGQIINLKLDSNDQLASTDSDASLYAGVIVGLATPAGPDGFGLDVTLAEQTLNNPPSGNITDQFARRVAFQGETKFQILVIDTMLGSTEPFFVSISPETASRYPDFFELATSAARLSERVRSVPLGQRAELPVVEDIPQRAAATTEFVSSLANDLATFFVPLASANQSELRENVEGESIALLLSPTGDESTVFNVRLQGKDFVKVTEAGKAPVLFDIKKTRTDSRGQETADVDLASLLSLVNQKRFEVDGFLANVAVDKTKPVVVAARLNIFGEDLNRDPQNFDMFVAHALMAARLDGNIQIVFEGREKGAAAARLTKIAGQYGLRDISKVFVSQASAGVQVINLTIPEESTPFDGSQRYLPVAAARLGDVPAYRSLIAIAATAARIDLSPDASIDQNLVNAYRALGARLADGIVIRRIVSGQASKVERILNALRPLTRVTENFNQVFRALMVLARSA